MRSLRSFCLLVGALFAFSPAFATVVLDQTLEEMTQAATLVVRARVGSRQVSWDTDHRRLWTFTEIQVTEHLKGQTKGTILVRQPGGVLGGIGQRVAGAAQFEPGEELILFLEPALDDPTVFLPLGMSAGKVLIQPQGLEGPRAVRRLNGLALYKPGTTSGTPLRTLDVEDLGTVSQFMSRLRRASERDGR